MWCWRRTANIPCVVFCTNISILKKQNQRNNCGDRSIANTQIFFDISPRINFRWRLQWCRNRLKAKYLESDLQPNDKYGDIEQHYGLLQKCYQQTEVKMHQKRQSESRGTRTKSNHVLHRRDQDYSDKSVTTKKKLSLTNTPLHISYLIILSSLFNSSIK